MADPDEFNLEESLRRLNELLTMMHENVYSYARHVEKTKSIFDELKERGYKMIPFKNLKHVELSELTETGRKNVPVIEDIYLQKLELIKVKKFDTMFLLRNAEDRLVDEIIDSYLGRPSIHFKLHDAEKKEIFCRAPRFKFQVPLFIFDRTEADLTQS